MIFRVLVFISLFCNFNCDTEREFCSLDDPDKCNFKSALLPKYLLYDVNPPEGFNLRRDVYMRLAIFMHNFSKKNGDWHLVLPPWNQLYHWTSKGAGEQARLPWSLFFDLDSLRSFAPVIEFTQFMNEMKGRVDQVFVLQHFPDAFTPGYQFGDKWEPQPCTEYHVYTEKDEEKGWEGWWWGYRNLTAQALACVAFEGSAASLPSLLEFTSPARSVMLDRAEIILHEKFGDKEYWECRKSMKFSSELRFRAALFRLTHLNSTDRLDNLMQLKQPNSKQDEGRKNQGGPYLAAHLRRRDFARGRPSQTPSLDSVAAQIEAALTSLKLDTVFIATDAPEEEFEELEYLLEDWKVVRFTPTAQELASYKDGGVAIIDQIICSYARWFIGTHESTFSFRIHEEREILGMPMESTFNRFCKELGENCRQPTRWSIVQ